MSKPSRKDRFTASGDTIPPSRPSGPGGGSYKVWITDTDSVGAGGIYPSGTRMVGYQADVDSIEVNRGLWYLANSIDYLFELDEPEAYFESLIGQGSSYALITHPVYIGETGDTKDVVKDIITLRDSDGNELTEGTGDNEAIRYATDIWVDNFIPLSAYPAGSLPEVKWGIIEQVTSTTIKLTETMAGLYAGACLFNYSKWLRNVRDGANDYNFIDHIIDASANPILVMGRSPGPELLKWEVGDEVYISRFVYPAYIAFNGTITNGIAYKIGYPRFAVKGYDTRQNIKNRLVLRDTADTKIYKHRGLQSAYESRNEIDTTDDRPVTLKGFHPFRIKDKNGNDLFWITEYSATWPLFYWYGNGSLQIKEGPLTISGTLYFRLGKNGDNQPTFDFRLDPNHANIYIYPTGPSNGLNQESGFYFGSQAADKNALITTFNDDLSGFAGIQAFARRGGTDFAGWRVETKALEGTVKPNCAKMFFNCGTSNQWMEVGWFEPIEITKLTPVELGVTSGGWAISVGGTYIYYSTSANNAVLFIPLLGLPYGSFINGLTMGLQYSAAGNRLSAALCYKRKDATQDIEVACNWGNIEILNTDFNWVRKDVTPDPQPVGEYLWYLKLTGSNDTTTKYIYALKIHIGVLSIFP